MKEKSKKYLLLGLVLIVCFVVNTLLVLFVDVKPLGQNGTNIGLSAINLWFHNITGVYMNVYVLTDWLSLIPLFVCLLFGVIGFIQLVKRKSLLKVDFDLITLGIYYIIVIGSYFIFEIIPINYRPILIDGVLEVSYPSSTTLLVLSVMPTLKLQAERRMKNKIIRRTISITTILFTIFMVVGRLLCGVHWISDIVGGVLLSSGLFMIYKSVVLMYDIKKD